MGRGGALLVLAALALALNGARIQAAGIKVGPAGFIVHGVAPGRLYDVSKDTGLRLTIYNDNPTTQIYVLSVHRPSERGQWEKGYLEIPDARWIWFDRNELAVPPNGKESAGLFLKVPDDDKYCNQHWVATLGVTGKPGAGSIALAVDVRAQIETMSKSGARARPDGAIGFAPGCVRFEKAVPGRDEKAQAQVYNNTAKERVYRIEPLKLEDKNKAKAYLTASFEPIPNTAWLDYPKNIKIAPNGMEVFEIKIRIPKDAPGGAKKWEEILLVAPDEGLPGFVRVQVETAIQ